LLAPFTVIDAVDEDDETVNPLGNSMYAIASDADAGRAVAVV
jgi:hypothetical protein